MELVNVVCLYWGDKYKTDYVQVLYNMVKRHLTIPHKFICYTDHVKLHKIIDGDIEFRKLPFHNYQGWWNKLTLFSPEAKLDGTNLFFDLDVIILDNIDCFATYEDEVKFIGMNDFNKSTKLFNSSVMKFNNKIMTKHVWQPYLEDKANMDRNQGDQNVISHFIKKTPHFKSFPDEWTFSAKWYDRESPRFHKNDWTFERKTSAKVAVFHGKPNPHESDVEWVKNHWK
jgi:hypothetical protein